MSTEPRLYASVEAAENAGVWNAERWPNFTIGEFACKCGEFCDGEYFHDPDFLDMMQAIRDTLGVPIKVTSGHRCAEHNLRVGGALNSQHLRIAADISLAGHNPGHLYRAALASGAKGFGLAASFLHVDRRPNLAFWGYGRASEPVWRPHGARFDEEAKLLRLPDPDAELFINPEQDLRPGPPPEAERPARPFRADPVPPAREIERPPEVDRDKDAELIENSTTGQGVVEEQKGKELKDFAGASQHITGVAAGLLAFMESHSMLVVIGAVAIVLVGFWVFGKVREEKGKIMKAEGRATPGGVRPKI